MIELHSVCSLINRYLETGSSLSLKRLKPLLHFYYIDHKDSFSDYNIDSYDNTARRELLNIIHTLGKEEKDIFPEGFGKLTIEEFFFELCRKTHDPLIINVTSAIENEKSKQKRLLITAGIFFGVSLAGLLTNSFFRNLVQQILLNVTSSVKAIPIVGFLVSTCLSMVRVWRTIADQKMTYFARLRQSMFILSVWLFNSVAYSLVISGINSIPLVGFFFLMGSVMMVLNHSLSLARKLKQLKEQSLDKQQESLQDIHSRTRLSFGLEQQRNELIADVVTAVLMVGIVAVSSFVPGGFIVVLSCLTAIAFVNITQLVVNKIIKERSERRLESTLKKQTDAHSLLLESPAQGSRLDDIYPEAPSVLTRLVDLLPRSHGTMTLQEPVFPGTTRPFFNENLTDSKKNPQENEKKGDILLRVC